MHEFPTFIKQQELDDLIFNKADHILTEQGGIDFVAMFKRENYFLSITGLCLRGAFLTGANLSGMVALETDFTCANLAGANFSHAKLDGAKFMGANLDKADFSSAIFSNTNFYAASKTKTKFPHTNLRQAKHINIDPRTGENVGFSNMVHRANPNPYKLPKHQPIWAVKDLKAVLKASKTSRCVIS